MPDTFYDELRAITRKQDDGVPARLRRLDPAGILVKGFEVVAIEGRRGGERFENADGAGEFAVERRGVNACRLEQPALGDSPVVGERTPDQDAREQGAWKHGAENQNEQVDPDRTQQR